MALLNAALVQPQRLTTAQRSAILLGATDVGRTIVNTDTSSLEYWDGTAWVRILDAEGDVPAGNLTGTVDADLITTGELDGGQY